MLTGRARLAAPIARTLLRGDNQDRAEITAAQRHDVGVTVARPASRAQKCAGNGSSREQLLPALEHLDQGSEGWVFSRRPIVAQSLPRHISSLLYDDQPISDALKREVTLP